MGGEVDAPRLVGRSRELRDLREWWARAWPRPLQLVCGEAGVGKTSLVTAFGAEVRDAGARVVVGRCDESSSVPYQPFVELLNGLLSTPEFRARLEPLPAPPSELVRLLPRLDPGRTHRNIAEGSDEGMARGQLFQAVSSMLNLSAADRPVLAILDDLQWADKPSLLLLRHVVRSLQPDVPFSVLGTYRDTDLSRGHPLSAVLADLRRDHSVARAGLRGFTVDEAASLMALRTGFNPSPAFADAVWSLTSGNPFFLTGLIEHLEREQLVEVRGGQLVPVVDLEEVRIPESVAELVGQRLSRLSEPANEVLRVAAVVGDRFALELVEDVSDLPTENVLEALEEGIAAGLLVEGVDARTFRFSHALVRRVLYEELSSVRKARSHRRIGEAIERRVEDPADYLLDLAHHFLESTMTQSAGPAIRYARLAGDQSMELLAYEQAADLYERALQLAEFDPAATSGGRLDLMLALARAQGSSGDGRSTATLREAWQLANAMGNSRAMARIALEYGFGVEIHENAGTVDTGLVELLRAALSAIGDADESLRVQLLSRLASELFYAPDSEAERKRLVEEAVGLAERVNDPGTTAAAMLAVHEALWTVENIEERLSAITRARALATEAGRTHMALVSAGLRLNDLLEVGDIRGYDEELASYEAVALRLRHPIYLGYVAVFKATRALVAGDLDAAEEWAGEAVEIGQQLEPSAREAQLEGDQLALSALGIQWTVREQRGETEGLAETVMELIRSSPDLPALGRCGLVWPLAKYGAPDVAQAEMDRIAAEGFTDLPRDSTWLASLAYLAESAGYLRDETNARVLYAQLAPFAGRYVVLPPPSGFLGPVDLYLGRLAQTVGDRQGAQAHLREARRLCEAVGATRLEARARELQAEVSNGAPPADGALEDDPAAAG